MARSVGPVTTAAAGGAAAAIVLTWGLESAGVPVPEDVQGAFAILFVVLGGWLVPSTGKRVANG